MKVTLGSSFENDIHKAKLKTQNVLQSVSIEYSHTNTPNTPNTPNTQTLLSKYFKQNIVPSQIPSIQSTIPSKNYTLESNEIIKDNTTKEINQILIDEHKNNNDQKDKLVSLNEFTQILVDSLKKTLSTNQEPQEQNDKRMRIQQEEKKIPISHNIQKLSQLSNQPSISKPNIKRQYKSNKTTIKPFHPNISLLNHKKNTPKRKIINDVVPDNNEEWNINETMFEQKNDYSTFTQKYKEGKNYIDIKASDYLNVLNIDDDKNLNTVVDQKQVANMKTSDLLKENFPEKLDKAENETNIQYTIPNTIQNTIQNTVSVSSSETKKINEAAKRKFHDAELASKNRRNILTQRSRVI